MSITESTKNAISNMCRKLLCAELRNVATQTDIDEHSLNMLELLPAGPVPANTSTPRKRRSTRAGLSPTLPVFPSFIEKPRLTSDRKRAHGNDSFLMTEDEDDHRIEGTTKLLEFDEIDKILTENDSKNVLTCKEINELLEILNSVL